jgi:cytochrome c peroxidase
MYMKRIAFLVGVAALGLAGCDGRVTDSEPTVPGVDDLLRQSIAQWGVIPIGTMPTQNPAQVALGRALFFDKVLSGNRDISCASCHDPAAALSDGRSLPVGTGGTGHGAARVPGAGRTFVPRQSPSLLNAGLGLFYVFWDGRLTRAGGPGGGGPVRSETGPPLPSGIDNVLVAQAMLPVLNRVEMRGKVGDVDVFGNPNELAAFTDDQSTAVWQAAMKRLMAIPEYVQMFTAAFPGRAASTFSFEDAARALAAFQMESFTKTQSAFDRYLERDNAALTAEQKRGASLFFNQARCGSCHSGPFLGGQQFANVGVPQIGPGIARQLPLDFGRAELQNNEFYRFAFRVAPLRNVELTAPYMHNGAYATLENVVNHYNNVQLALSTYDPSQLHPALRALYHGEPSTNTAILSNLDGRLRGTLNLSEQQKVEIVAFLKSLTDPSARDLSGITPSRVPSGLPVQ